VAVGGTGGDPRGAGAPHRRAPTPARAARAPESSTGAPLFSLTLRTRAGGVEASLTVPEGAGVGGLGRPPHSERVFAADSAGPAAAALALSGPADYGGAGGLASALGSAGGDRGAADMATARSTAALVAAALGVRPPPPPPPQAPRPAWLTSFDMHIAQFVRARDVRHVSSVLELPWPPALRGAEIAHLRSHPAFAVVGDWIALAGTHAAVALAAAAAAPGGLRGGGYSAASPFGAPPPPPTAPGGGYGGYGAAPYGGGHVGGGGGGARG